MPHTKSAFKRLRKSKKRAAYNRAIKARINKVRKRLLNAIQNGDVESARNVLKEYYSAVDKAQKKGVLHKNAADRKKTRATEKFNKLLKAKSGTTTAKAVATG
jgi:small subunit ribosomal protein S20